MAPGKCGYRKVLEYNSVNEGERRNIHVALDTLWRFLYSFSDCVQAVVAGDCFLRGILPVDDAAVSRQISFRPAS